MPPSRSASWCETSRWPSQGIAGQQERDEAATGVGRIAKGQVAPPTGAALQPHPVRSQRRQRQAEHPPPLPSFGGTGQRARRLQPALDGQVNVVPRLDDPFIEPHPQPRRPQPFRQPSHPRLVRLVVAQENVVLKFRAHGFILPFVFAAYGAGFSLSTKSRCCRFTSTGKSSECSRLQSVARSSAGSSSTKRKAEAAR